VRCPFSLSHCICGFHLGFTLDAAHDAIVAGVEDGTITLEAREPTPEEVEEAWGELILLDKMTDNRAMDDETNNAYSRRRNDEHERISKDQTMTNRYTYVKSRERWYVIDTADREARHTYDYTEIRGQIVAEFPTRDEARAGCKRRNALAASAPSSGVRGA
jgi:hypothetical protein